MSNINVTELATFGISLHKAILNNLIEEVEQAIEQGKIRSQDGKHSVYDFLTVFLEAKSVREVWKRFVANDPETVTFCDSLKFNRSNNRAGNIESPATSMIGLIYIAYTGSSKFSKNLRRSSAILIASEATTDLQLSNKANIAYLESALNESVEEIIDFPVSIEKIQATTNIVNKNQIKKAIKRDLILNRDYIDIKEGIFVTLDMFHILVMSFRSMQGTDISQLPEIIRIKTEEYFRVQNKKANSRMGKLKFDCGKRKSQFYLDRWI